MKKILLGFIVLIFGVTLMACEDETTTETIKLTVWASSESQDITQTMINEFKEIHKDKDLQITLGAMAEGDTKTEILKDVSAGADVYTFVQDHLQELVTANAISQVGGDYAAKVKELNVASSVQGATADDKLYAYPMTADNGYFMYYDKSVFAEADLESLDGMIAKAKSVNKSVMFDIGNGFYTASFLYSNGNSMNLTESDFENEHGQNVGAALKYYAQLGMSSNSGFTIDGTVGVGANLKADGVLAAGVSGPWDANAVSENLGENYGAVKLPTATIGGEQVQLSSYAGFKLIGVNPSTKHAVLANELALFLSNEANQLTRFEELGFGPSNINAAANQAVKDNVALSALAQQSEFAVPQTNIPGPFWDSCTALVNEFKDTESTKTVAEALNDFVTQIFSSL